MPLMEWSDETLSVHVDIIDRQHKKMIGMINELYDAVTNGRCDDMIDILLIKLFHYTGYHFSTEEQHFREHEYPDYDEHKFQHDVIRNRVMEFEDRNSKKGEIAAKEVLNLLKFWLFNHILGSDVKFGRFLNEKGIH
jgi:hemerythrin